MSPFDVKQSLSYIDKSLAYNEPWNNYIGKLSAEDLLWQGYAIDQVNRGIEYMDANLDEAEGLAVKVLIKSFLDRKISKESFLLQGVGFEFKKYEMWDSNAIYLVGHKGTETAIARCDFPKQGTYISVTVGDMTFLEGTAETIWQIQTDHRTNSSETITAQKLTSTDAVYASIGLVLLGGFLTAV